MMAVGVRREQFVPLAKKVTAVRKANRKDAVKCVVRRIMIVWRLISGKSVFIPVENRAETARAILENFVQLKFLVFAQKMAVKFVTMGIFVNLEHIAPDQRAVPLSTPTRIAELSVVRAIGNA